MVRPLLAVLALTYATQASASSAGPAQRLALVDLAAPLPMLGLGQQILQLIAKEAQAQGYVVVSADDVAQKLGPRAYDELQRCGSGAYCAANKLEPLGVDRAILGSLGRDDKNYLVHLWLVDLRARSVLADVDRSILIASRRLMTDVAAAVPDLLRGKAEAKGILRVTSNARNASVSVDGNLVGTTPVDVQIKPGKHEIKLEKKAYLPVSRFVTVAANDTTEEQVRLLVIPGQRPDEEGLPGLVAEQAAPRPEAPGVQIPAPAWITLGVGAAAAGTGAVLGALAAHTQRQLQAGYNATTQTYSGTRAQALNGRHEAVAANILYGVAGAALVTAGVLTLALGSNTRVSVAAGAGGAALALEGRF